MSYVNQNLMPDEQVIYKGNVHWYVLVRGLTFLVFGATLFISSNGFFVAIGALAFAVGIGAVIQGFIYMRTTELVVTTRRIIAKFGFIKRNTVELSHDKVESLNVAQSLIGRLLDFGTVLVNGTGGNAAPVPAIAQPLSFRRAALKVLEPRS